MYICIFVCLSVYMYIGMYERQSLDTLTFHLRNRNCQADFFGVNVLQTNCMFSMLCCFNLQFSRVDFAQLRVIMVRVLTHSGFSGSDTTKSP